MPDNKLKDNEIIKALECCYTTENPWENPCKNCPLCDVEECNDVLMAEYVKDLINRQKAENERLRKLQKPTETGGFRIENGKVVFCSDMLNGYRHEYKDLDEIVKELNLYMHTDYKNIELISHYKYKAQTAKSEAYKEFADEIFELFPADKPNTVISRVTVKHILKELLGDDNA